MQEITSNVVEEAAVSPDILLPDPNTLSHNETYSAIFSEGSLLALTDQPLLCLEAAGHLEAVLSLCAHAERIYLFRREFAEYQRIHQIALNAAEKIVAAANRRLFPTFFRVGFYGLRFGPELDSKEFIYREDPLAKLSEVASRFEVCYSVSLLSE